MKKIFYSLIFVVFLTNSCTKDEGPVLPEVEINEVSFSNDIQPIFDNNCISCHPSSGNLDLTAGNSYNQLVNINASGYTAIRVIPNEPENSVLYKKIDGSGTYGSNMPLGGSLNANEVELIRLWIEQGAKNN